MGLFSFTRAASRTDILNEGDFMLFSGMLFLFAYLPLFFAAYFLAEDERKKNYVLVIASLLFYLFGGAKYLLLLLAMAEAGFFAGKKIGGCEDARERKKRLILSAAVFLAVLALFKYTGFFVGTLGAVFRTGWTVRIALPLGISFYIFKLLSYIADVYSGKTEAEEDFLNFLLYLTIFHQILQGPIVRYTEMKEEIRNRTVSRADFAKGAFRFSIGLAKKAILADHLGELAGTLLPVDGTVTAVPTAGIWLGSLCYTMQIYLDFSAYSDMAVALGLMAGFHYPENFNYPYLADSIKDFWKRWHISLSTFFRDYVYIPLGGNRRGAKRTVLNLLAVWLLTGLWHGASWNFILWGLYYFAFVCLENLLIRKKKRFHPVIRHIYALFVINFGWILFRFTDLHGLRQGIAAFFGIHNDGFINAAVTLNLQNNFLFLLVCILACTPLFSKLGAGLKNFCRNRKIPDAYFYGAKAAAAGLLLVLAIFALAGNSYQPFLYNQF